MSGHQSRNPNKAVNASLRFVEIGHLENYIIVGQFLSERRVGRERTDIFDLHSYLFTIGMVTFRMGSLVWTSLQ